MLNVDNGKVTRVLVLCLALLMPNAGVLAQKPKPKTPTQTDASKPPGSEQNPNTPPGTRPETQNPATPPASQQPAPQAPPGNPNTQPGTQPTPPGNVPPTTQQPGQPTASPTPVEPTVEEPGEPNFPSPEPRPMPPMPNLTRLGVVSSNVVTLTVTEAIRLALANNNDIEVSKDDVRYAETQLHALEGVYDPLFTITPQIDKRVTPIQNIFSGAPTGKLSTGVLSIGPAITKSFSTGGGTYELSFSNTRNTTSATSSTLNPYYSSNLALIIVQPLWRNRSIDNNRRQIRIQKKRIEQSDADFRQRTIDVIAQVQSAYWDLVFALRDQQVQLDNVNLSRENLRQIEAQISAGAKAPLDRSEVLTELATRESSLLSATQTVSLAENALKQLILRDATAPQWMAQVTPTDSPVVDTNPVNLNDAIAEARKNRPELQRLRLQKDINGIDLQYFWNQTKPQIDLVSTIASTGLAGTPCNTAILLCTGSPPPFLVGGFGKDLSNLAKFQTRNITVGVSIQIPLHNTTAKANLAGARIQQEQLDASVRSTEQTVEVEVRNSAQAVESARLQVLAAREARRNAEIQLEGEQRLYSVGRSTTYLLIQRQNALANARDSEVRAETNYSKAVSGLQHATSTTLHANNVTVDNPLKP
ncbi:MAG TPA: TolC family protein [Pyrinomonadaceae bacterium]|nr:TolC family protein [Pyrinomonadaceae bacterium]